MATVDVAALFWYFMFIVHCRQKEALEEARRGLFLLPGVLLQEAKNIG